MKQIGKRVGHVIGIGLAADGGAMVHLRRGLIVQFLAGHATLASTQIYIEGESEEQRKIVDLIFGSPPPEPDGREPGGQLAPRQCLFSRRLRKQASLHPTAKCGSQGKSGALLPHISLV